MIFLLFVGLAGATQLPGDSDWPQFRGPQGLGVAPAADIAHEWSEGKNVEWKVSLPGQGWSQPIVIGQTIYLTTAVGEGVAVPIGLEAGMNDPRSSEASAAPSGTIDWRVIALDLADGKERWSVSACKGKPALPIHPSNTWASETPVADANGVYAFCGAMGTLAAFDPQGKPLWRVELGVQPMMFGYGTASSPMIHEGKLFVQSFGEEGGWLACFDSKSGRELWRVAHEPGSSWSTPLLWRNEKRVELVAASRTLITGHEPVTGKELWRLKGILGPIMSSFAADPERLYLGQAGAGSNARLMNPPLYALAAGGEGDLSAAEGAREFKGQVWSQKAASPGMPSPVAAEGLLYVVEENLLACRDAASGDVFYRERVPGLVTVVASPILIGEELLLLDEEGHAALVRFGPDFEVIGHGALEGMFWSTPAVAGNSLLLRATTSLYCVRK